MGNYYIQEVERLDPLFPDTTGHRVYLLACGGHGYSLRSFKSMAELKKFAGILGFKYEVAVSNITDRCGRVTHYNIDRLIYDQNRLFWDLSELPAGAEKITLTENGSDVTCYFTNDGATIQIYRPNCNAKNVYKIH